MPDLADHDQVHMQAFFSAFPLIGLHVDQIRAINGSDKGPDKDD